MESTTTHNDALHQRIMDVLATVPDPEMPINIVDLGLIEGVHIAEGQDREKEPAGNRVEIDVLPTFVGCPALPVIETKVLALDGVAAVEVHFIHQPPWSIARITDVGREQLREIGITVPDVGDGSALHRAAASARGEDGSASVELRTSVVACPFCGSNDTRLESMFGPTRCKMIYYCDACRNPFEHLKNV